MGKAAATMEIMAARSIQIVEGSVRARVNRPTGAADSLAGTHNLVVADSLMVAGNLMAADNLVVADSLMVADNLTVAASLTAADRVMAANRTGAEEDTPDNRFPIDLC
jgi:hypothetical protein